MAYDYLYDRAQDRSPACAQGASAELFPLLREDRPTVLSMLPSALFALTRDHGARDDDFVSLRLCSAAGDTVSAELDREFTALSGFAVDEAYGLTETGLVTVSHTSEPAN